MSSYYKVYFSYDKKVVFILFTCTYVVNRKLGESQSTNNLTYAYYNGVLSLDGQLTSSRLNS